ncbi:MAG: exodeoxyribonuclease VII large subunit [Gammaproteobacteria bacterium]
MENAGPKFQVYSVSEVAEILRGLLEDSLPAIRVQGEISNFRNPSGHWYFVLKDADAQLRCAMFKGQNYLVKPQPKNGDAVVARGRVTYYGKGGDAQLVVDSLEPAGEGALLKAFAQLKARLAAEGLFDESRKRPIPEVPRGIGLVTSPTGAALQDILSTLRRRFPLGQAWLWPVPVQGASATPAIMQALAELPRRAPVDVIVLARGGGSIEDLACFNHEGLARAIRACAVPVVTGIGHEIDFTIADFAADLRAPTPTGAAERVSPDADDWHARIAGLAGRLEHAHPGRRLQQWHQRLDELWERIAHRGHARLRALVERVKSQEQLLASLNPRAVLERGYAIARTADGRVLSDAARVAAGDALDITLARGSVGARVVK